MQKQKEVRFFPIFLGATAGMMLEVIAMLVDEVITGHLFADGAFAAVNLVEPLLFFETFLAYLVEAGGAALIIRARGAGDYKKMSEIFSQTLILCGLIGVLLTVIYVLFTPGLIRFLADDPTVYEDALAYFKAVRFYPLVDMFDTFLFCYVLYFGGYVQFYTASVFRIGVNAFLSWQLGSRMGLMGIALATILSLVVGLLIKFTFLLTKKHGLKFRWYFNIREALEMARLGVSESALNVFIVLMELGINTFTFKNYAGAGVAAVAVVVDVFEFVLYLAEGISEYETVAINDSIGKDSRKSMNRALKVSGRAVVIEGVILAYAMLLMSFHSCMVSGMNNKEALKQRIDAIVKGRLLPALDNAQPLDF